MVIAGTNMPIITNGLVLDADANNSTIKGLAIVGYRPGTDFRNGFAILILTNGNKIEGNFLGIAPDGITAIPNNRGVEIINGSDNVIGGITPEQRNIISGNSSIGIAIFGNIGEFSTGPGAFDNQVIGNYIGTNSDGTSAVGNNTNVQVSEGAKRTIIGGLTSSERNLISGATSYGILLGGSGTDNTEIKGNFIGTDVNGTGGIPNQTRGIFLTQGVISTSSTKQVTVARNIISGNNGLATSFTFSPASPGTIPL